MHVFDVEEVPKIGKRAVVRNARDCTTCRECLESFPGQENFDKKRDEKEIKRLRNAWEEKGLVLGKAKDHFIFSIESVGQIPAGL